MPISKKVKGLLETAGCRYELHTHPEAFTAQGLAAVEHTPGREIVKVVILKGNENYYMAALPAPCKVDLARFAALVGVPSVRLATEEEFKDLFPGCETGAMPPFGHVFGLPVFLEESLTTDESITFSACTHRESIRMKLDDYIQLVKPHLATFATPAG
jgi:Ala-tRNA(Pro) deacylase